MIVIKNTYHPHLKNMKSTNENESPIPEKAQFDQIISSIADISTALIQVSHDITAERFDEAKKSIANMTFQFSLQEGMHQHTISPEIIRDIECLNQDIKELYKVMKTITVKMETILSNRLDEDRCLAPHQRTVSSKKISLFLIHPNLSSLDQLMSRYNRSGIFQVYPFLSINDAFTMVTNIGEGVILLSELISMHTSHQIVTQIRRKYPYIPFVILKSGDLNSSSHSNLEKQGTPSIFENTPVPELTRVFLESIAGQMQKDHALNSNETIE
jgi:hypothetical protein